MMIALVKQHAPLLLRFLSVGLVATAIHAGIYSASMQLFATNPQIANLQGYCVAVVVSYLAQKNWTFAHTGHKTNLQSFSRFITASLFGLALNAFWVFLVNEWLGISPHFALIGIVFLTPATTLFLLKFWVFK